jgi:arachidonate 5-lipoxygenase
LFEVAKREYKKWKFFDAALPAMLKQRNMPGPEELPKYFYRDDATAIWEAILNYTNDMIGVYYKTEDDIKNDTELQEWAAEINKVALKDHGFPSPIKDKAELGLVLTTIIFTVSAQHAAVNFSQFETFAYIPASPGALYSEPPCWGGKKHKKGDITEKFILKSMPPKHLAAEQVAVLHVLSSYSDEDSMLGSYPECLFVDRGALNAIEKFKDTLKAVTKKIVVRNEWGNLCPVKIPNSTAI